MTTEITVAESDIAFACEPGETILDAAERAGYSVPYSCRKGVCTSCKGGLKSGTVAVGQTGSAEGPADILFCVASPTGPVEIAPLWIGERTPPARRKLTAKVYRIDRPATDVSILHLRLPIGRRAPFRAGQYIQLLLEDGGSRNYSLANPPHDNDVVELHVRHMAGGRFSDYRLKALRRGDTLEVVLPFGMFYIGDDDSVPAVLLATGTGFAPLKSIVEDLARRRAQRPVHLFWGGRIEADLYQLDLVRRWTERLHWFRFTPVLSQPAPGWNGAVGRVQDTVLACCPDLTGHEVYACGNPAMVEDARALLTARAALADRNFLADAFVPSGVRAD